MSTSVSQPSPEPSTTWDPPASASTEEERAYYRFNQRAWSLFAPFYDLVTLPMRRLRAEVCDLANIDERRRVLDVATGTGEQAFAFAAKAREVVAVDLSPAMLRIAERKERAPKPRFLRADAASLPFPAASFDAACISFALHEMPRSVRGKVVREMARVVRPGGTVVVVDWSLPEGAVARWLVFRAVRSFEGRTYEDFVRTSVPELLASAGVSVDEDETRAGGIARIVVGRTASAEPS